VKNKHFNTISVILNVPSLAPYMAQEEG